MSGTQWRVIGVLTLAAAKVVQAGAVEEIQTVIVQAEKRDAPVQSVPIAISALSAENLAAAGVSNIFGLADEIPALDVERNAGLSTMSLRIRRVGNIGNIPTFEPAVGVFVDGAYRSRSFLGTTALPGVDHVEVLRGPQTALYGKNVSAGVLGIYTQRPAAEWTTRAELTQGAIDSPRHADLTRINLDLSGPLTERVGAGLAAQWASHGHTFENVLPGGPDGDNQRELALRGQVAWSPTQNFDARLLAGYMRAHDDDGEADVYLAPGAASTQVSTLLQGLGLTPGCSDNIPRNRKVCSVATNGMQLESVDITALLNYRMSGELTLTSTTSWDRYRVLRIEDDAIQLYAPMLFYRDAERSPSIQEEIRLSSSDTGRLSWQLGSFYYHNQYERGGNGKTPMFGGNGALAYDPIWLVLLGVPLALPGQLGVHDSQLVTDYLGVFGQSTWKVTSNLLLTAAVRWQEEEKHATISNSVTSPGVSLISAVLTPSTLPSGEPVNGKLRRKSSNVPWSLTPQYRFSDDALVYLTTARGSKAGGFNTGFGNAPLAAREYADETVRHYEIGAKLTLADRRVLLNAAAFNTRYDNYQDAAFISAQFSVGNARRVDLKGFELDSTVLLNRSLTLNLAASRASLRYVSDKAGLCYPGRVPDGNAPGTCDLSGEHPIHAPEWETHADLLYRAATNWGELSTRVGWSWTSRYNTSFSADPRLTQAPYNDVSLRLGAQFGKRYQLVFWADNLLDEKVTYADLLLNLFNDASYQTYPALPRSYGVSLRLMY